MRVAPVARLPAETAGGQVVTSRSKPENLLFDGAERPKDGELAPKLSRPGLGFEIRRADGSKYAVR